MSAILNMAAQRTRAVTAGITGPQATPPEAIPTAPLLDRILAPADWGGLGHLFTDLVPMSTPSNVLTQPVAPQGATGGSVPAPLARPAVPTAGGSAFTRIKKTLGL